MMRKTVRGKRGLGTASRPLPAPTAPAAAAVAVAVGSWSGDAPRSVLELPRALGWEMHTASGTAASATATVCGAGGDRGGGAAARTPKRCVLSSTSLNAIRSADDAAMITLCGQAGWAGWHTATWRAGLTTECTAGTSAGTGAGLCQSGGGAPWTVTVLGRGQTRYMQRENERETHTQRAQVLHDD
jgi:hypothetical protein